MTSPINFEEKYVAFIDVLGFSDLVFSNDGNAKEKLNKYFDAVESAFKIYVEDKPSLDKIQISDSIILIAKDSPDEFKELLKAIRTLQCLLATHDIWVRGGISFGEVYNDNDKKIVVGKGYIKAYLLEKEAIFPRIIIDPSILGKMELTLKGFYDKFNSEQPKLIHDYGFNGNERETNDDAIFVSYGHKIVTDSKLNFNDSPDTDLQKIYFHIKKNLYGPQKHYGKYLWLKKYFKEIVWENYRGLGSDHPFYQWLTAVFREFSSL